MPELRAKYRHLAWSNSEGASDEAYICAALVRASFFELVDFYAVFGLDRLREVWRMFQAEEPALTPFEVREVDGRRREESGEA